MQVLERKLETTDNRRVVSATLLAAAYRRRGDPARASAVLEVYRSALVEAGRTGPGLPTVLTELGEAAIAAGRREDAIDLLGQATAEFAKLPGSPPGATTAQEALSRARRFAASSRDV